MKARSIESNVQGCKNVRPRQTTTPRLTLFQVRNLRLIRISLLSVWASHGAAPLHRRRGRGQSLPTGEQQRGRREGGREGGPKGQEGEKGRFTGWRGGAVTVAAWIPLPPPTRHAADARGRCHRACEYARFLPPARRRVRLSSLVPVPSRSLRVRARAQAASSENGLSKAAEAASSSRLVV